MKKSLFIFLALFLVLPSFVQTVQGISLFSDTPGDGFATGDDCGYVMGVADPYPSGLLATNTGTLDFDSVTNSDQGCIDSNGNFYSSSSRESYADFSRNGDSVSYVIDFDYSSTVYTYLDYTSDPATAVWKGTARLYNGTVPPGQRWIDFEWTCSGQSLCDGLDPADYYVRTDMSTGEISGYAWSDYFDEFISFNGLTMELPPEQIVTYVDILANNTSNGPDDVDYTTAPLADGGESWKVRVQFLDTATGEFLTSDDLSYLAITPGFTSDTNVYMNQVENTGDALDVSYYNPYMGCTSSTTYCVRTESDGSESFNTFIFSGAPTDNVLGLDDDTDTAIEYYSDRDGCRWIYSEQGTGSAAPAGMADCPDGSRDTSMTKTTEFFDRSSVRNKIELEYVTIQFTLAANREMDVVEYAGSFELVDDNTWRYYPDSTEATLSFRPRFQIANFVALYDGTEHTSISEDLTKTMSLKTEAVMHDTSAAFQARSGQPKPSYTVYYQMDATSSSASDPTNSDLRLLIDTDDPPNSPTSGDVEETKRTDSLTAASPFYASYNKNYAIGYGQAYSKCSTAGYTCQTPTNTLTDPTAEQWVCDDATETTMGDISCYYTEYLPHIDRHKDPESMLVIGAINSTVDAADVLQTQSDSSGTVLSILGTTETINLRNKMYSQVARYTLGQTATGGSFESDGTPTPGLVSLMNDRLIFAQGDVAINGFDGADKTLVVVGGDVAINTNITNGRMGIIVFRGSNGEGGNVYVRDEVTEVHANLFLDGSLFSYHDSVPSSTVYPSYTSDELRLEVLLNQLYLKGSLVSRNTVGGASDETATSFDLGDGTTTSSYDVAREYDLNMLRQYRLCHPIVDGVVDETVDEECNEGEQLSSYTDDSGASVYNSFILEYDPADELPIFTAEYGLFN